MSTTTTPDLAEHVIATLRAHEAELRRAGFCRLSLFDSVARGDAEVDSDVDFAAELDPEAGIGLFAPGALECRLAELFGRKVVPLPEPVEAASAGQYRSRSPHGLRHTWPAWTALPSPATA